MACFDRFLVIFLVALEVPQLQAFCPISLMQIHQHRLFQLRLAIIDDNRVVMSVESVDKGLNGGFVDMPDVRRRLTGFLTQDCGMGIDKAEGIDDYFAFDRLNRINDDSD